MRDILESGLSNGSVEFFPEGGKAYFMKGVDKKIMIIRPVGVGSFYYVLREYFDKVPNSPADNK